MKLSTVTRFITLSFTSRFFLIAILITYMFSSRSLFVRRPSVRPLTFSNHLSAEAAEPVLLNFDMEPPLVGGTKEC